MNKFKFFADCKTLQEVKVRYRELVFKYHPDRITGDLETMKAINNEYELAFEYIKNHPINEQEEKTSKFANVNDGYREILEKVIFIPDIYIEICGCWVWITGDTKPVKDIIKNAGFSWAVKKKAWYWKPYEQKRRKHKEWDMDRIRDIYGSQKVQNEERERITA